MLWRVVELQPVPGRIVNSHRGPNVCHLAPAHRHFTLCFTLWAVSTVSTPVTKERRGKCHHAPRVNFHTRFNSLQSRFVRDVCSSLDRQSEPSFSIEQFRNIRKFINAIRFRFGFDRDEMMGVKNWIINLTQTGKGETFCGKLFNIQHRMEFVN